MATKKLCVLFTFFLSMVGTRLYAYEFAAENADGVLIYYNYNSDGTELIVTNEIGPNGTQRYIENLSYEGNVIIPEELTFMSRTRKVTGIEEYAFAYSSVTSVTIPKTVTNIGNSSFLKCRDLTSITIPINVTIIGDRAFYECISLTSFAIPNSVTSIGDNAFKGCIGLTSITIPQNVTYIGKNAFEDCDLQNVISFIENPFEITAQSDYYRTFSNNTYYNATLYVPNGTISKYKATEGWKDFKFIEEGDGSGNNSTGLSKGVTQVSSKAIMIKTEEGKLTIEGAEDNISISVYSINGVLAGTAISRNGIASIYTSIPQESVAIVKIGNKSIKVIMK